MSSCIARASLWRRLGQSSGPYTGPVVNLPRPECAYFHIGIDPADRRHLRFCHTAPLGNLQYCYAGCQPVREYLQNTQTCTSICPSPSGNIVHVHDWLLNPGTYQEALEQTSWLKSLCRKLGLVLNLEKSDLIPSQVATYLRIELDTSVGLARPSHKRLTNWLSVAEGFTAQQSPPAVQWLQVLGNLVSLEKLVPYGRIRIHPTQWQLRLQWSQSKEISSKLIPLDLQSRLAF